MRYLALALFTLSVFQISAQFNETIRSARGGQTIGTFTVGKGVLQFQHGVQFADESRDFRGVAPSGLVPDATIHKSLTQSNNIIRYGIWEKFEISAVVNYNWAITNFESPQSSDPALRSGETKSDNLGALDLGFRFNILDGENDAKLALCLQSRAGFTTLLDNSANGPDVKTIAALGWRPFDRHVFRINAGYFLRSSNTIDEYFYGIDYSISPFRKCWIRLDYSVLGSTNLVPAFKRQIAQLGIVYLLHDEVQLDVYGGYSEQLTGGWPDLNGYQLGAGISWRILTANN